MKKIIFISTLFLAYTFAAANAANESVESEGFSPAAVRPGEAASYRIELKNISPTISISQIPIPAGLNFVGQSQSSSFSMGMGSGMGMQSSRSVMLTLSFVSDTEGEYTIPEWKISHEGKDYTVASSTLKVDKSAPAQASAGRSFSFGGQSQAQRMQRQAQRQAQGRSAYETTHDIESSLKDKTSLELKIPRNSIFVGETVPCELVFYFDRSLYNNGFRLTHLLPQAEKIDDFECPGFDSEKPTIDHSSDPDRVIISFKSAITPIKAGSYELDFRAKGIFAREISLEEIMDLPFFERMTAARNEQIPFEIQMDAEKIEVKELPSEGRPENFSGAIGSFKLDSVKIDPDSLSADEPCNITLKISGSGNFARMQSPVFEKSENWKSYKFKSTFFDESGGLQNRGVKTFEASLVPLKADLTHTPNLDFYYFNPEEEKYVKLEIPPEEVSVAPAMSSHRKSAAKKVSESENQNALREIADTPQGSNLDFVSSPIFWILQIAILGAFAVFIVARKNKMRLLQDPAYAKREASKTAAKREIKKSLASARSKNADEFFNSARSALQYLLSANTEYQSNALLLREAESILREINRPDLVSKISIFFEGSYAIKFGAIDKNTVDFDELSRTLVKICKEIENENLR